MSTYVVRMHTGEDREIELPDGMPTEQVRMLLDRAAAPPPPELRAERPPSFLTQAANFMQQEAIPTAGMLAGGALGGLTGPGGAALGAGLGYAGGKSAVRLGQSIADVLAPTPRSQTLASAELRKSPSLGQQAGRVGQDIMTGATAEMLPPALGQTIRGAGRGVGRFLGMEGATPANEAFLAASQRQGVPSTVGALQASKPMSAAEHFPSRFPIGMQATEPTFERIRAGGQQAAERFGAMGGPAASFEQAGTTIQREVGEVGKAQASAVTELVDRFTDSLGASVMPKRALGGSVGTALGKVQQAQRRSISADYAAEAALVPKGTVMQMPSLGSAAATVLEREASMMSLAKSGPTKAAQTGAVMTTPPAVALRDLPEAAVTELMRTRPGLIGNPGESPKIAAQSLPAEFIQKFNLQHLVQGTGVPYETALLLRQRLAALIRNETDDEARRGLRQLATALGDDFTAFANSIGGDASLKLGQAALRYKKEIAGYFTPGDPLRKLLDSEPGQIADKILAPGSTDLRAKLMQKLPARQQAEVQQAVMAKLKGRSLDPETGEVDPAKLTSNIQKLGPDDIGIVFGKKAGAVLQLARRVDTNFGRATQNELLAGLGSGQPENLVKNLTVGKIKSVDDFNTVMGAISPQAQRQVRSATMNHIVEQSFDPRTNQFSMERFMTAQSKVPREIWEQMLEKDQRGALEDLRTIFARHIQYSRAAANPSGTSAAILGPAQILGASAGYSGLIFRALTGDEDAESFSKKAAGLAGLVGAPYLSGKVLMSGRVQRGLNPSFGGPGPRLSGSSLLGRMGILGTGAYLREEPDRP